MFKFLSEKLNEHLKGRYNSPEEMVTVSAMSSASGAEMDEIQNKMVLSLVNLERETAMGIGAVYSRMPSDMVKVSRPPWHLNLVFVAASVFNDKQYLQSLRVLSSVLEFFQAQNVFFFTSWESNVKKEWKITVEPVNLNYQELTNLWSVLGGKYYPSMVGKIRMVTVDAQEIESVKRISTETQFDFLKDE
ncbi:MAG: DUF4255 domain-containing protein [Marinifilaceae bacterium]